MSIGHQYVLFEEKSIQVLHFRSIFKLLLQKKHRRNIAMKR